CRGRRTWVWRAGDGGLDRSRFVFSSRRRHTSFSRDWSSDVCSSDLAVAASSTSAATNALMASTGSRRAYYLGMMHATYSMMSIEIGRASCRERVLNAVGAAPCQPTRRRKTRTDYAVAATQPSHARPP